MTLALAVLCWLGVDVCDTPLPTWETESPGATSASGTSEASALRNSFSKGLKSLLILMEVALSWWLSLTFCQPQLFSNTHCEFTTPLKQAGSSTWESIGHGSCSKGSIIGLGCICDLQIKKECWVSDFALDS